MNANEQREQIVELTAENVKRLRAVRITPEGNLIVVGGRNSQGKSSVLDAIGFALVGTRAFPTEPVRHGAQRAKIVCRLKNMVVTRTITPDGGGSLVVTNADGTAKYSSPQKMLDALLTEVSFDPLAFMRMKPREQVATLRQLVKLDFSEMDAKRQSLYDERTQVNRRYKETSARLATVAHHPDAPAQEVPLGEVLAELNQAHKLNQANAALRAKPASIEAQLETVKAEAEKARQNMEAWRRIVEQRDSQLAHLGMMLVVAKAEAEKVVDVDLAQIEAKSKTVEDANAKVRCNALRAEIMAEAKKLDLHGQSLTLQIEDIDEAKRQALTAAKMPVAGLSFEGETTLYNGIPLDQASSSEQLRVSVAMGLALNPRFPVLRIYDGSLLDAEGMSIMAEMARAAGAQVFIERVSDDGAGCSVVIVDGEVAEPKTTDGAPRPQAETPEELPQEAPAEGGGA